MSEDLKLYDENAERSVLGGLLVGGKSVFPKVFQVLSGVRNECFYQSANQYIFDAIVSLNEQRKPMDAIMLQDQLSKNGTLPESGGLPYIIDLTKSVPTSANVEYYAEVVEKYARKRKMFEVFRKASLDIFEDDPDDVSADVRRALIGCEPHNRQSLCKISEYTKEVMIDLEGYVDEEQPRIEVRTGIDPLDDIIISLRSDESIILAARPSVGKSAVAANIALNVAMNQNLPVLFFSLEMKASVCLERVLSMVGKVDIYSYRQGRNYGALADVCVASEKIKDIPLWINDSSRIDLAEMQSVIRLHVEKYGNPALIVVDYLQIVKLRTSGYIKPNERIEIVSAAMKEMARDFSCPVISLSQIGRGAGDEPTNENLSGSGALENDADKVIILKPEEKSASGDSMKLEVVVSKNRTGRRGACHVAFVMSNQLIRPLDSYQGARKVEEPKEEE